MTMLDALLAELKTVIPACALDIYKGTAEEYIVVSATESPTCYGDDHRGGGLRVGAAGV